MRFSAKRIFFARERKLQGDFAAPLETPRRRKTTTPYSTFSTSNYFFPCRCASIGCEEYVSIFFFPLKTENETTVMYSDNKGKRSVTSKKLVKLYMEKIKGGKKIWAAFIVYNILSLFCGR